MDQQDRKKQEEIAAVEPHKSPFDTFGVAIFLVVLAQLIVIIGLNLYQKGRFTTMSDRLAQSQATLASPEYAGVNAQLDQVLAGQERLQKTLSTKVRWSQFYTLLNGVTPKNVRISALQLGEGGTFRADGQTPSMASLAQLLVAWQKGTETAPTPFSTVVLASNSIGAEGGDRAVNFSITGSVNLGRLQ